VNNLIKIILLTTLFFLNLRLYAQKIIIFNPSPDFFLLQRSIGNAASYDNEFISGSVNYKNRIGAASDIRDIYFDLSLPLKKKHHLGLKIYSEQETTLFSKNKFSLFYNYKIKFNKKTSLTLAANSGLSSITFESSNANNGGSDLAPDISVASLLTIKNFDFGISFNQITQSTIRPINYEFTLTRYLDLFLSHKIDVNQDFVFKYGINPKMSRDYFLLDANVDLSYKEQFGVLAKIGKQYSFATGAYVCIDNIIDYKLKVALSYSNAYYTGIPGTNSVGVSLYFSK
jgi:hypothetical protein